MDRLQKKCLIGTTGMHLLLVIILVVCPGFFTSKPKVDDTKVLVITPDNTTDQPFNSGVPKPTVTPPTPKPPTPVPPTPVQPPPPPPKPTPEPPKPVEPPKVQEVPEQKPPDLSVGELTPRPKPVKHPPKPVEDKPEDLLKHKVVKNVPVRTPDTSEADAEREAQREAKDRARAFKNVMRDIQKNATEATEVQAVGSSSVSYANYAQVVRTIYDRAWTDPENVSDENADTQVKVVINRDGTVISARIISPSGDAAMDASVRQALDRVTEIRPFPEGSTEKTKTFIIDFNLKSKRQIG